MPGPSLSRPGVVLRHITHLWFTTTGERAVFHQLSFRASPGRRYRIAGAPGAGKTTLLRLLCGLTRPTSGSVVVDGVDLEDLDRRTLQQWRKTRVGLALDEPWARDDLSAVELAHARVRRAFRKSPSLVLLDEPGRDLDPSDQNELGNAIDVLQRQHRCTLFETARTASQGNSVSIRPVSERRPG